MKVVYARRKDELVPVLVDDDFSHPGRLSIGSHGYVQLWVDGRMQTLHRWLMGATGLGYRVLVDHRNRDKFDCRRANLRRVTPSVSNRNRAPSDNPTAGTYRTRSGRWHAAFKWHRHIHHVGTYDTQAEAVAELAAYRQRHAPESLEAA